MHRIRWFLEVGTSFKDAKPAPWLISIIALLRVYRAYNHDGIGSVAACKVVSLYSSPTSNNVEISSPDLKELEKEVQVHRVLKHQYVLEFMDSKLIKPQSVDDDGIMLVPGLYVLLELAMGGDLFDKIGE